LIKKWVLIKEGIGSKNNLLAIGKNILICYLTWKGYNFEDAIIINERLIYNNLLTSIKIKKIKIFLFTNELEVVVIIKLLYFLKKIYSNIYIKLQVN
jgi:DNA-directed RNA polymerase subunit beta